MRLLVCGHHSDTGFGVVTQELSTRFLQAGIDVRILAVNHRGEPVKGDLAGRVWPANIGGMPYGGNVSGPAIDGTLWPQLDRLDEWKPDQVLVISDVSGLYGHMGDAVPNAQWQTVPVLHYCPIEGDNLSPAWIQTWKHVQPIAMSTYGQQVISSFLGRQVPMVYHGVDTDVFRPLSQSDPVQFNGKWIASKEQAKAAFGFDPKRKLILRSDRLVERKFYDRFMAVMGTVLEADKDTDVVIHCRPVDDGLNIYEEIARQPPSIWNQVKLTNAHDTWRGLPREGMVVLMNAADLYVSTTGGEGFGLNLAEAMACEVPVVVTDWAADKEVVGPGGITVPPLTDSYGEPVRYHSSYGMDWAVPDPKGFVEPVLTLLSKPSRRRSIGHEGRAHVVRSFSWDRAASQFLRLFEEAHAVAA